MEEAHGVIPTDLTLRDLEAYFHTKYPDANKEVYSGLFKTIADSPVQPELAVAMLQSIKLRKQAMYLSEQAFKLSSGNADLSSVAQAYEQLGEVEQSSDEFEFVTTDIEKLLNDTIGAPGLRWRLDFLNKSLGSLRKGNFGFLFARPETGKTTFLASEVSHMLTQLKDGDGPIIWINNEQAGGEVMLRVVQAYFGITLERLLSNRKKYNEAFQTRTNGRFLMLDDAGVSRQQIEQIHKRYKPSLIVYDQIDKIKGFAADREDLRLGAIYVWARELAKAYCPSIGVCQAGQGGQWLTMDDVANAKTSKQAEADWIVGIGISGDHNMDKVRYLNISKNKLLGDPDTRTDMRHARGEVLIAPEVARYEDVMKYD